MRIGEVSKKYNIAKDTLYYYIKIGILVPGLEGEQYNFDENCIRDIKTIASLKNLDFSLSEIHAIISLMRYSNLKNPQDVQELIGIYENKYNQLVEKSKKTQSAMETLKKTEALLRDSLPKTIHQTGVPVSFLDLLICPKCSKRFTISNAEMDNKYIYSGILDCACGYHAAISKGILQTPNKNTSPYDYPAIMYKDLPPDLVSLFQKSYNYMDHHLGKKDLKGKVVLETHIGAFFFLQLYLGNMDPNCRFIIVDKFPEILAIYKNIIESQNWNLDILYLADAGMDYPIIPDSIDIVIDYFSANEHNCFSQDYYLPKLQHLLKADHDVIGTYFSFDGQASRKSLQNEYPECKSNNFVWKDYKQMLLSQGYVLTHEDYIGFTLDSGNNVGFSYHVAGDKLHLHSYEAKMHRKSSV
jgi:DNA-binding transcriptional MerR regulator